MYTVIKRKKTRRGTRSHTKQQLTRAQIKEIYPYWDGKSLLLRADARSGLVIEIEAQ